MSWSSPHPLSTGGSHKTSCELQDPKGTPGLGGVVGSGACLEESSLPQGCPLPQSCSLCGPMSPASGHPLQRCFYSMRNKVSDSQDMETSRLSIHRATEKQDADRHCPKGTGAQYWPQRIGRPPKTSCSEQDSKGHRVRGPVPGDAPSGRIRTRQARGRQRLGEAGVWRVFWVVGARDLVVAVDHPVKALNPTIY